VEAALRPVLDDQARATITETRPDGTPKAIVLTYPPRAASKAGEARGDLIETLRRLYPPLGAWFAEWHSREDRFVLVDRPDPLAPVVQMAAVEQVVDLEKGPVIGIHEDGSEWRQQLLYTHLLIAGSSGAGKGSVIWGIIRGLAPMIESGLVRLWVIDPKGGMELGSTRGYAHRYAAKTPAIVALLQDAVERMEADQDRMAAARRRKVGAPTKEHPFNLVIVDELAGLTAYIADSKVRNEVTNLLSLLLSQGRAPGWCVVGALQDPRAENLKARPLFNHAIALRLNESTQVRMVLGDGMRQRGALCDLIPDNLQGVGYVVIDGVAEPQRVRAAFVPDDETERLADHLDPTPPPAIGAPIVLEAVPTLPEPGEPVRPLDLVQDRRYRFEGETDVVTIVDRVPDADVDDAWLITYRYDGETIDRATSVDDSEVLYPA
jgi:hypothetical protein